MLTLKKQEKDTADELGMTGWTVIRNSMVIIEWDCSDLSVSDPIDKSGSIHGVIIGERRREMVMRDYEFVEWVGSHGDVGGYVDLDGNPVARNPRICPYSYDTFVLYKSCDFRKSDVAVDSDRMLQWDREKFFSAVWMVWPDKAGSQVFSGRKPKDINTFLGLYFKRNVKLTAVLQNCNKFSGRPYWTFFYKEF